VVKIDPFLLVALLMLALTLGALLVMLFYKAAIERIVAQQLDQEMEKRSGNPATFQQNDAAELRM
jgi:uncharacterized membrane protein YdjX (TVP38/TMEM64 family)